ncbi:MAG: RsmG family class I SAM-dependent methyltransferase, partial [Clostridiales bacterium]
MDFETIIKNGGKEFGIEINDEKIDKFKIYKELLISWNKKINLTSITDDREIAIKHFIDSLSILQFVNKKDENLIDIGTGAGFPGIPIKIILDDI